PHYTPPPRPAFLLSPTPTTWTCTLSLHDALPICERLARGIFPRFGKFECRHEIIQQTAQPLVLNDDFPPIRAERGTADIQSSQDEVFNRVMAGAREGDEVVDNCLDQKLIEAVTGEIIVHFPLQHVEEHGHSPVVLQQFCDNLRHDISSQLSIMPPYRSGRKPH